MYEDIHFCTADKCTRTFTFSEYLTFSEFVPATDMPEHIARLVVKYLGLGFRV